jgi:hypothetical protein
MKVMQNVVAVDLHIHRFFAEQLSDLEGYYE